MNWQRAFILWFQGKVEILDHHDEFARTVREKFKIPSIIRLRQYVKVRQDHLIRFSRENLYVRDEYMCQYCGDRPPLKDLTMDHVLPVSRGGQKNWENVVTACKDCNQKKRNRMPEEAGMPLKKRPIVPSYLPKRRFRLSLRAVPDSWKYYLFFDDNE